MENGQQKADAKESEESSRGKGEASSNDDEASRRGYLTNDEQLDYGSAGSDLSDLVEEELRRDDDDDDGPTKLGAGGCVSGVEGREKKLVSKKRRRLGCHDGD